MYIWFINEGIVDTSVKASPRVRATMNIQVFSPENIFEYFLVFAKQWNFNFYDDPNFWGFSRKELFSNPTGLTIKRNIIPQSGGDSGTSNRYIEDVWRKKPRKTFVFVLWGNIAMHKASLRLCSRQVDKRQAGSKMRGIFVYYIFYYTSNVLWHSGKYCNPIHCVYCVCVCTLYTRVSNFLGFQVFTIRQ